MEYRKFDNYYVVRINKGEEIIGQITELCEKENIKTGFVTGLGASDRVVIGLYDTVNKVYKKTELTGPMEITSLIGNISVKDGKPYLHFHINVCDETMSVKGGHLNECYISATAEITITVIDGTVEREFEPEIGLNLYKFI